MREFKVGKILSVLDNGRYLDLIFIKSIDTWNRSTSVTYIFKCGEFYYIQEAFRYIGFSDKIEFFKEIHISIINILYNDALPRIRENNIDAL